MAAIEKIREAVQHNEEKKKGLRKSILMLMMEWKNFEGDFDIAARCLIERFNELEVKEKHLSSVQESVMESCKELDLIKESVEEKEEKIRAFREREIRDLECKWEEFSLARKEYDGVVKLREEKLNVQEKMVERVLREVESEHKQLEDLRKSVEDKFMEISMKEKEFDKIRSLIREDTNVLRLKERKFMERVAEFEIKEKCLQSMEKEMENKERCLDSARKDLVVKENCLDNVKKELRVMENKLVSVKKELELKDKSGDAITKKLELQEQELTSLKERLQLREGELNSIQNEYGRHLEELDSRKKRLDSVSVSMQKSDGEFELEMEDFQGMEDIALKEKQVEVRCTELTQREKHIDDQFKLLEEKEKQLKAISSAPVNPERIDYVEVDKVGAIAQLEECVESLTRQEVDATSDTEEALTCRHSDSFARILIDMGGKNLQTFLNDHWEEHELLRIEVSKALEISKDSRMLVLEALGGFYPTEPNKEEIECNSNIIRKSCILLLEELMSISPVVTPQAKLEAGKRASDWKAKMMAETENHLAILGFLFLVGAYGLAPDFDKSELESLCSTVAQHGQVTQICHALGISVINGEPLSNFVEKRSKQQKGCVYHSSSDPAKIVLDALRKCYSAEQLRGVIKKKKPGNTFCMKRFSDLLEHLERVSPEIRPSVKIEATEFAVAWRTTLTRPWEVLAFFNLLATFELSSSFDSDDLLGLLVVVHNIKTPPICLIRHADLIKSLGIADKVPCFIEKLIQRRELLVALTFIYEFELYGLFPLVPLLKKYVSYATKQAKQIHDNGPCSLEAREKAIVCERSILLAAVERIGPYSHQLGSSPDPLIAWISDLAREKENIRVLSQEQKAVKKQKTKKRKVERLDQQPQHPSQFMQHNRFDAAAAAGGMFWNFPGPDNHFMVGSGVPPSFVPCTYPFHHHQSSWRPS